MAETEATLAAINALHFPYNSEKWLPQVIAVCRECSDQRWPCRTKRLIDALDKEGEKDG